MSGRYHKVDRVAPVVVGSRTYHFQIGWAGECNQRKYCGYPQRISAQADPVSADVVVVVVIVTGSPVAAMIVRTISGVRTETCRRMPSQTLTVARRCIPTMMGVAANVITVAGTDAIACARSNTRTGAGTDARASAGADTITGAGTDAITSDGTDTITGARTGGHHHGFQVERHHGCQDGCRAGRDRYLGAAPGAVVEAVAAPGVVVEAVAAPAAVVEAVAAPVVVAVAAVGLEDAVAVVFVAPLAKAGLPALTAE